MRKHRLLAALMAGVMLTTSVPETLSQFIVSAGAASEKLAAPSGLKAVSVTSTSIKLKWDKVTGASAYRVYMYDPAEKSYKKAKQTKSDSCTISGLQSGTQYRFKVAALVLENNKYIVQEKSGVRSVTTQKLDISLDEDIKVTKKIKVLANYDLNEDSDAIALFKETYGVPGGGDNIFDCDIVNYNDRFKALAQRVAADDSPDMVPFDITGYPRNTFDGLYRSIDGIIDTNTSDWSDTRALMDQFMWGGKNYAPIVSIDATELWYYRKSVVKAAGLTDPYTLYKQGKWTWKNALKMAKKYADPDNGKFFTDGWYVADSVLISSGTPLISINDGKLVNNLGSDNITRVCETLRQLYNYGYPLSENGWNVNIGNWVKGNTLFYVDGKWSFSGQMKEYASKASAKKLGYSMDDIMFVPVPKDDKSDIYYAPVSLGSTFLLVSGAKNIDGYKAWVQCCLKTANDAKNNASKRMERMKKEGWSTDQFAVLEDIEIYGKVKGLFDFRDGLTDVSYGNELITPMYSLPDYDLAQMRKDYTAQIDKVIKKVNKKA